MRILFCGDRYWTDYRSVHLLMESLNPTVVIAGGASGADTIAEELAYSLEIDCEVYPAEWQKYGKAAGPIRNTQMLKEGKPEAVVAFHENLSRSKGTRNMIEQARKSGVDVIVYPAALECYSWPTPSVNK